MEQQKAALVEALCRKGSAMCRIYTITNTAASKGEEEDEQEELYPHISVSLESIDNVWRDVLRFTDTNDTKVCISCMSKFKTFSYHKNLTLMPIKLDV